MNLNTDSIIELLKRFFYQILGIYLPAFILFLFMFITWRDALEIYFSNLPVFIKDNITYQIILLLISSVILGEGINAFTAWLTKISPINLPFWGKFRFFFKKPIHILLKDTHWPIWINLASFPVTFAVFDRYYIATLDEDKRTLAGKIGWTSFYRNCGFVFVLMVLIQSPYMVGTLVTLSPKFQYITLQYVSNHPETFINNIVPILSNIFPYVLPIFLIPAFVIAYKYHVKANKQILWNAYRRNELRKVFEEKYGDLAAMLNITNSSNDDIKKMIIYYIIDRWFLAIESTIRDLASYIISDLERQYRIRDKSITNSSNVNTLENLKDERKNIKENLMEVYEELYRSNYEIAISLAIKTFDKYQLFESENGKNYTPKDDEWWKFIKGSYLITFLLRTEKVYEEVEEIVNNHNLHQNLPKENISETRKFVSIMDYSTIADIVWESSNEFKKTFTKIREVMKIMEDSKNNLEKVCHADFRDLCIKLGGYDYQGAQEKCEDIQKILEAFTNK